MKQSLAAILMLLLWPALSIADESAPAANSLTFVESFRKGEVHLALRYRFENVDQAGVDKDATASTLRTSLSYGTKPWKGFSFFIEAEDVHDIGTDGQYNSTRNGVRGRPVVADPENTELNQVFIRLDRGQTQLALGRQEIVVGQSRFVGNVGWRQVHQSFDSLKIKSDLHDRVHLTYAFLDTVNRIFGDNRQLGGHVIDIAFDIPSGSVRLYGLRLDYDELRDARLSTSTFGAELTGSRSMGDWKLMWEAEYADQSDIGDNPVATSAAYIHGMGGFQVDWFTAKVGIEILEGSARDGQFQTPLATLHKFNGWADKFLSTPTPGLEDSYIQVAGKHGKLEWAAHYHDFSAESASIDYGSELDLQVTFKTKWAQTFGIKAAFYDAERFATDTDKIWVWTSYQF